MSLEFGEYQQVPRHKQGERRHCAHHPAGSPKGLLLEGFVGNRVIIVKVDLRSALYAVLFS
jgi:hypothetical protein